VLESEMAKVCTTCSGARRVWRSTNRKWWQALLGRPPRVEVLCPECNGIGVLAEHGDNERHRQTAEHAPKKPLGVRELVKQYDEKQALLREKKQQVSQIAARRRGPSASEKEIARAERRKREAAETAQKLQRQAGERALLAAENEREARRIKEKERVEQERLAWVKFKVCPR